MKNNLILGLSTILAVSACSSKTTTLAPTVNFASLTPNADGLVTLPVNQVVNLTKADEILKIKFDDAPTGAKVKLDSLLELSNVTIEVTEGISGESSIVVNGTPAVGADPISYKVQSEDLDSYLKAEIGLIGLDDKHIKPVLYPQEGHDKIIVKITDYNPVKDVLVEGSPTLQRFEAPNTTVTLDRLTFTIAANDAKSTVQSSFIQNDNTLNIVNGKWVPNWNFSTGTTANINDGNSFKADAVGEFTYKGVTVVSAGDYAYLDLQSELKMNFTDNTGTYSSSNFKVNSKGEIAANELKNIEITGNLSLNNTTGAITSTTGTVVSNKINTVSDVTSNIDINANMTTDHSAVAGVFTVKSTERSNQQVDAGVFGFVKNENITK